LEQCFARKWISQIFQYILLTSSYYYKIQYFSFKAEAQKRLEEEEKEKERLQLEEEKVS